MPFWVTPLAIVLVIAILISLACGGPWWAVPLVLAINGVGAWLLSQYGPPGVRGEPKRRR